jgi:hypothetical protein
MPASVRQLNALGHLDDLRFVLTEGRFIAGGGFDVPDRAKAVISREWIEAAGAAEEEQRAIGLGSARHGRQVSQ